MYSGLSRFSGLRTVVSVHAMQETLAEIEERKTKGETLSSEKEVGNPQTGQCVFSLVSGVNNGFLSEM